MAYFLSRISAGEAAVRRTSWFAFAWFLAQLSVGLAVLLVFGLETAESVNFVPKTQRDIYWITFDAIKVPNQIFCNQYFGEMCEI